MTRPMSASRTSLSLTATMPCELSPRTCAPEIAAYTVEIWQPAMFSASSIAAWIELTVVSMFTTTPRRRPLDGAVPMPMMSMPSSVTSPAMHAILVVPMSRPTMISEVLVLAMWGGCSVGAEGHRHQIGAGVVVDVDGARAGALVGREGGPGGVEAGEAGAQLV